MVGIFEQARACIGSAVIEQLLHAPNAEWRGDEYFTLNPTRADSSVGSFSINGQTGLWHDFASNESGDLVDLLVAMRGATKREAAEEIVRLAGGTVRDERPQPARKAARRDRPEAQIPAPEAALKSLNAAASASWVIERHGRPVKGWTYRTAAGGVAFAVTRHEKPDGSKDVLPWYFGVDGGWHNGQAYEQGRPLYKLDQIAKADRSVPILVVEGEKCASIDVPGYLVTTWAGGASATARTEWAPLEGREVVIWPDADAAGAKAAAAIERRLPGARILSVAGRASGWDLADAVAEGIDPIAFIASAMPATSRPGDAGEFCCLGHDGCHHWFLRAGVRMPYKIALGSFTSSKLLSLAPLAFWAAHGQVTDQGSIKTAAAQDYVESMSFEVGQYRPERIRGAGVWRDKDGMMVNDGARLIMADGHPVAYDAYQSENYYISSSTQFGAMIGAESTAEDGRVLQQLFRAQGFSNATQAILAMGWALIAPFGGVLRWRPHIWVTGRKGSGKSWVLEDLIRPLCGPFAHKGSGKDSEAGIRRALNQDARPVILDEMEPKGQRAAEKVASILDLARNASSDGSGYITIASPDGGAQRFVVRSCFCFGSIQTPDEGAAIASRISKLELRAPVDQAAKFRESGRLFTECMSDPGRFTRRIFRALPRILADIEWIRTEHLWLFGDQRRADQIAPLLAAAWAVQSDQRLAECEAGSAWLADLSGDLAADADAGLDDEEEVIDHILAAHIKVEHGVKTVAELLRVGYIAGESWAQDELARYGIRVYRNGLAIADRSEQIRAILRGTVYAGGYGAQIKRHRLCMSERPAQVRLAGNRAQCWVLDWARFREEYIEESQPEAADRF